MAQSQAFGRKPMNDAVNAEVKTKYESSPRAFGRRPINDPVNAEVKTRYESSPQALGFLPWFAALPLRLRRLRARLLMVNSSDRAEADGSRERGRVIISHGMDLKDLVKN